MARHIRRVNSRSEERVLRYTLEDGNAVREPACEPSEYEVPERHTPVRKKGNARRRKKAKGSAGTVVNPETAARARAVTLSRSGMVFLAVCLIVGLGFCLLFLRLNTTRTTQKREIAALQDSLSKLQEDNDAYEKEVDTSEDLDAIREEAMNRLKMHYPSESQIRYYNVDADGYVRQYADVPDQ